MEDFKVLLRIAMKPRTVAQFAENCGVSKGTISKLLNGNGPKPTMQMLQKFANNAYNYVTLSELVKACGYPLITKDTEIKLSSIKEMLDPKEFVTTMKKAIIESINTIQDTVKSREVYMKEIMQSTFSFPVSVEKVTSIMFAKNKVSMFIVSSEFGTSLKKLVVCVMFSQQLNGFCPINVTTDTVDIVKMGFDKTIQDMIISGEFVSEGGYNFLYSNQEVLPKDETIDKERLLKEALTNKYQIGNKVVELEEIPMIETGFGFYLPAKPTERDVKNFAAKHVISLPDGVQKVFVGNDYYEDYQSMFDEELYGPEALILDILRVETGFAWIYREDRGLRMFAVPTVASTEINPITLKLITSRLAKQLSAERYGTVYWTFTFMEPFPEYPL
jgi:transcriptional regulator with XRE-family HTH domain